jgi:hypothetical protein
MHGINNANNKKLKELSHSHNYSNRVFLIVGKVTDKIHFSESNYAFPLSLFTGKGNMVLK